METQFDSDEREIDRHDNIVRPSSDVRVSEMVLSPLSRVLIRDRNAEAGIALICTCLPAFVAQFNILRDRVGYGSSRSRGTDNAGESSGGPRLSSFRHSNLGTMKSKKHHDPETWSDEAELVTQVRSSMERESNKSGGIVRRVEVTHTVTYAGDSDDGRRSPV
jgi:hypothetical protein